MYTIKKDKDDMRALFKERRAAIDPGTKSRRDAKICRSAISLASYRYAEYVLMYAPTEEEIDIMPVALDALSKGKRVAFPKCYPETHTMDYRIVSSVDELGTGYFGLREPPDSLPLYDPVKCAKRSVCFVPGLVYDTRGFRLGYGKGFYDRYLSSFGGNIVGIVYSDFIVPEVPRGRFDITIKILLTEKGVVVTGEN